MCLCDRDGLVGEDRGGESEEGGSGLVIARSVRVSVMKTRLFGKFPVVNKGLADCDVI